MRSSSPVPGPEVDGRPVLGIAATVAVLAAVGVLPVWAGLPHHVALPPLDLFADVRVLLAQAQSYPQFVAALLALVVARALVLAAVLGGLSRRRVAGALSFYATMSVPALVAGSLAFSALAVMYALFLWSAVALSLVVAVLFAPVPWAGWGWMRRPLRWLPTVVGYLAVLLVLSALTAGAAGPARIGLLLVSAGVTVVTIRLLASGWAPPRSVGAGLMVVVLLAASTSTTASPPVPTGEALDRGALFLVAGVDTSSGSGSLFELDPTTIGFTCERTWYFSYAGSGAGAPRRSSVCPVRTGAPYEESDTHRPLSDLATTFRQQVAGLPGPVVVVTHSQAGWIARAALARGGLENVGALVMLAPFPSHALPYVPAGEPGRGVVGSEAMRAVIGTMRAAGHTSFEPEAPLALELLATPGAIEQVMLLGARHPSRTLAVTAWVDLPLMPHGWRSPGAVDACPVPVPHGDLFTAPTVTHLIRRFIAGEPTPGCPWWRTWLPRAGEAFAVPTP